METLTSNILMIHRIRKVSIDLMNHYQRIIKVSNLTLFDNSDSGYGLDIDAKIQTTTIATESDSNNERDDAITATPDTIDDGIKLSSNDINVFA